MYANFTLHLKITDRAALYRAAMASATGPEGTRMPVKDAREILGTARKPDISTCETYS